LTQAAALRRIAQKNRVTGTISTATIRPVAGFVEGRVMVIADHIWFFLQLP
jgi:hypothetical protein